MNNKASHLEFARHAPSLPFAENDLKCKEHRPNVRERVASVRRTATTKKGTSTTCMQRRHAEPNEIASRKDVPNAEQKIKCKCKIWRKKKNARHILNRRTIFIVSFAGKFISLRPPFAFMAFLFFVEIIANKSNVSLRSKLRQHNGCGYTPPDWSFQFDCPIWWWPLLLIPETLMRYRVSFRCALSLHIFMRNVWRWRSRWSPNV